MARTRNGAGDRPGVVLAVLAAAQFAVVLSTSVVNVALPALRDGVGLSEHALSWVVGAYGLAFGALLLLGGRAADLLGARRVLLAGLALFAAAALAAGLSTTPAALITARAVQGVGAAAVAPAALALLTRLHPPGPRRGRALGVWGAVSGAGGAAGVLLGGALTQSPGWPAVFHATALTGAAVLVATAVLVPRGPAPTPDTRRLDLVGAGTITASLAALVLGLTGAGRLGWTDPAVLGPLAAAAVLLGLFVRTERRHPAPLLPPRLLTTGSVGPANLVMALVGAVWVGLFFFLPLYQQQVLGDGPLRAGLAQLPLAAANILGSALAPRLARRLGPTGTLTAGLAALATGLGWLSRLPADGGFLADVLGPSLIVGLGLGLAFVQLTGAAVGGVQAADAGLAGGLVNTTRQVGGAVGLAVLTSLAASATATATTAGAPPATALTEGYRLAFLTSATVIALAAACAPVVLRGPARPASQRDASPLPLTEEPGETTMKHDNHPQHTQATTPPPTVDDSAPVVVRRSTTVAAPLAVVWGVHTAVGSWADWNPDVDRAALDGPLRPGTRLRWLTHGLEIVSTLLHVAPGERVVWAGPAQGIQGVHVWAFEEHDGVVTVRTEESWSGGPVLARPEQARQMLEQSLETWLRHLRAECERRWALAADRP
ncbi:MFS transporter [Allostreptomyces psammosilenae]|uniref:EmrB/QacA subfamily drug resistance transporter n=1 Tax=Allostreptomyces psammosilenae TaxID=1892865 RepID=A0A852ZM47_9ACTN|nr:MFS transporter [Allostreptomyces psammosilenae]NYI03469.1 EmrB/QacA subfamily drug resistance transporter [Allostreptomyces psammosilenae]